MKNGENPPPSPAFTRLRVVELASGIAGPFTGKMFAAHGANVTKLELVGTGDYTRKSGPFPPGQESGADSGLFHFLNMGKKSVTIDPQNPSGVETFQSLVQTADVLIDGSDPDFGPLRVSHENLAQQNQRLVTVSVTPFGSTGPYSNFKANELVLRALSGAMYLSGSPDREPLLKGGNFAQYHGGLQAFIAAMAGLAARDRTGHGQWVDVSCLEAWASITGMFLKQFTFTGEVPQRRTSLLGFPWGLKKCRDGWVMVSGRGERRDWWESFKKAFDIPVLDQDKFSTAEGRSEHEAELESAFVKWLAVRGKEEIFHRAQKAGLSGSFVCTADDLMKSPQLIARKFFADSALPSGHSFTYPGRPYVMPSTPWQNGSAPSLGQHNGENIAERPHSSIKTCSDFKADAKDDRRPPLSGLRVLDLSQVFSGPYLTRMLGDLGAEVIKVESVTRPDPERGPLKIEKSDKGQYPHNVPGDQPYNRSGRFIEYNRNKYGITLDLRSKTGLALFKDLARQCDVVIENFSVGVTERLGIDYRSLKSIKSDTILLSMPAFGSGGPESEYVAFGPQQECLTGLASITGYDENTPSASMIFCPDPTVALFGVSAVLTALRHKNDTGVGQHIEIAQREATAFVLPEPVLTRTITGQIMKPLGNGHPDHAPHGCYPCAGDDNWIAIAATDDVEWRALCAVLGRSEFADRTEFSDPVSRIENRHSIDELISEWTGHWDHYELMHALQNAAVPAGAVLNMRELLSDPHYEARKFFIDIDYVAGVGRHTSLGFPWKFAKTPASVRRPTPSLGADSFDVLSRMLEISEEEYEDLVSSNVTGTIPLAVRIESHG